MSEHLTEYISYGLRQHLREAEKHGAAVALSGEGVSICRSSDQRILDALLPLELLRLPIHRVIADPKMPGQVLIKPRRVFDRITSKWATPEAWKGKGPREILDLIHPSVSVTHAKMESQFRQGCLIVIVAPEERGTLFQIARTNGLETLTITGAAVTNVELVVGWNPGHELEAMEASLQAKDDFERRHINAIFVQEVNEPGSKKRVYETASLIQTRVTFSGRSTVRIVEHTRDDKAEFVDGQGTSDQLAGVNLSGVSEQQIRDWLTSASGDRQPDGTTQAPGGAHITAGGVPTPSAVT